MAKRQSFRDIISTFLPVLKQGEGSERQDKTEEGSLEVKAYMDGTVKDEDVIVSEIKKEHERRREDRIPFELQWQLNTEFLNGNQYCDINEVTRQIDETPFAYDDEEREVFNVIAMKIEARQAKLSKAKPSLMVRPASDTDEDVSTALISTKIVKGTYNEIKMQEHFNDSTAWCETVGTVLHKDVWDPKMGRLIMRKGEGEWREGGIVHTVVPALEIYPESPFKEYVEQQRSIFHVRPMDVEEIEEVWGIKLPGREMDVYNLENSRISTGGLGYTASVQRYTKGRMRNAELVIEATYLPCKKYPKGKLITVVGDKLAVYMDLPWLVGDDFRPSHPFTKQVCIRRPGCFWGRTVVERLIPVQRRFNALKNKKQEYINRIVLPVWFAEQDSLIYREEIAQTGLRPGEIVEYRQGTKKPEAGDPPQLPASLIREEAELLQLFTTISGVSDFSSQSKVSPGTPGIVAELIRQQDDSRASLTSENIEIAAKEIGRKWLRLYKTFVSTPRVTRMVGNDFNRVHIMRWSVNDITSYDVTLETEDLLNTTMAQRRNMAMLMMDKGLLNDPETGKVDKKIRLKMFELFEMGNWESAVSDDSIHERRADDENQSFLEGMMPMVNPLDDDPLHIKRHSRFFLSQEFEDFAKNNPGIKKYVLQHIDLHKQAQINKALEEQQRLMALQPQPAMEQVQNLGQPAI